jgi:ribosome-binding protein aMBF1 (putative translation factor)
MVPDEAQVVTDGWDHEHCELCNKHIDPGDYACINTDRLWVCLSCFDNYAKPRDLSFVDEL